MQYFGYWFNDKENKKFIEQSMKKAMPDLLYTHMQINSKKTKSLMNFLFL